MMAALLCSIDNRVARLTLNRPGQLNAMNRALMDALIEAFQDLNQRPEIGAIVLTGSGRAFMAGADIKEYANQTQEQFRAFEQRGRALYEAIEGNSKPVIAAVNGYAFGGGFEIVLSCDLVWAARTAEFALPEIYLHLIPGGGGTQRLPRKVGLNRALELLLTGRRATAGELHAWGLVNRVCEPDQLESETQSFAAEVAGRSPTAIVALKKLARLAFSDYSAAGFADESRVVNQLFSAPPAQEAIKSFVAHSLAREAKKRAAESSASNTQ